jgi:hypothetical protein
MNVWGFYSAQGIGVLAKDRYGEATVHFDVEMERLL